MRLKTTYVVVARAVQAEARVAVGLVGRVAAVGWAAQVAAVASVAVVVVSARVA